MARPRKTQKRTRTPAAESASPRKQQKDAWVWTQEKLDAYYYDPEKQIADFPPPPEEWVEYIKDKLCHAKSIPYFSVYGNVPYDYTWNKATDTVEKVRNPVKVVTEDEIVDRAKKLYIVARDAEFKGTVPNPYQKNELITEELMQEFVVLKEEEEDVEDDIDWDGFFEHDPDRRSHFMSGWERFEDDDAGSDSGRRVEDDVGFLPRLGENMSEGAAHDEFGISGGSLEKFFWRLMHYHHSGAKYDQEKFCYF